MKMRRQTFKRIICALLAAGTLFSTACSVETTEHYSSADETAESTVETEETTEPEETEEPIIMIDVTDTLTMRFFSKPTYQSVIAADLNAIISNGYSGESLYKDAFAKILPETLIFNADNECAFMFRLGQRTDIVYPALSDEFGFYISAHDAASVFGGKWVKGEDLSEFELCGAKIEYSADKTELIDKDGAREEITVKTDAAYDGEIFINANHLAKMTNLVLYKTDSGLLVYSAGEALDPLKGYYVAEEAGKLFLETANEIATFSANMFVDIPKIMTTGKTSVKVYSYPALDLNAQVLAYASQGVTPPVTLGPAIVAGQGESDKNSTVVRIFDAYQTLHTQFRAYGADVKGGVQVACAVNGDTYAILTAPYTSSSVTELKVFDANGSYLFSVKPEGSAPYAIAAGAFGGGEDCFAVMPMSGGSTVSYYSAKDGSYIGKTDISKNIKGRVLLSTDHEAEGAEGLIISVLGDKTEAYAVKGSDVAAIDVGSSQYNGVYSSAFGGYIATNDATDEYKAFSTVTVFKNGAETVLDTGNKENTFYSTMAENKQDSFVKRGHFWHVRVEFQGATAYKWLKKENTASVRSNDVADFAVPLNDAASKYNTQYNMWEPCFTHRWNKTAQMGYLINYIDPDTGEYAYAALNREGERMDYAELSSSFYNASYAPYVQAMDRLRFWTMRSYLGQLAVLYKKSPEHTVAVSPVHEHEIDTGNDSVGDYSVYMIEGFREHLLYKYGSLEAINDVFGTEFATVEEIDPPRNTGRGRWDRYSKKKFINDYLTEWEIYNRTIVSQRIVEAYREALLAGFPPELIKAHQIPEGDAVTGVLGEANTRVSPVDVVLNLGTGYGGTRYSVWYKNDGHFFSYAYDSGHRNITLGEYSAMSTNPDYSYEQLRYMVDNGLVFTHVMPWKGNVANGDVMDQNEKLAVDRLQSENIPRSASSGGVGDAHEYTSADGNAYNIVEIGSKEESTGLLKSIKEDGTHEGSVYLQPFHAQVNTVDLAKASAISGKGELKLDVTGRLGSDEREVIGINHGDSVDIRINAKKAGGKVTVRVFNGKYEISELAYTFKIEDAAEYRYEFKNQLYIEDCDIVIEYSGVDATVDAVFMYEMCARRYYGETMPAAHEGGVSFDLITK